MFGLVNSRILQHSGAQMTTFKYLTHSAAVGICLLTMICVGGWEANATDIKSSRKAGVIPSPPTSQEWRSLKPAYLASLEEASPGRFQAVQLDGSSIFILDTQLGHLWVWAFGEQGGFTIYQGRVVPGLKMGDVIEASEKSRDQRQK